MAYGSLNSSPGDPVAGVRESIGGYRLVSAIQEQIESQSAEIGTLGERRSALEGDGDHLSSGFNPLWVGALTAVALMFAGLRRCPGGKHEIVSPGLAAKAAT